ncbi:MAG: tetratricopeptide repeat protein [Spirochaetes bacterium]|nr:tetratricopeptide repeat protein [Spirochaetota bacterium]
MVKKYYRSKNHKLIILSIIFILFILIRINILAYDFLSNDFSNQDKYLNYNKEEILFYFKNKLFYKVILNCLVIVNSQIYFETLSDKEKDFYYYLLGVSNFYLGNFDLSKSYFEKIKEEYFKLYYEYCEYYKGVISFFFQDYKQSTIWFNKISKFEDKINEIGKYYYYFSISLIQIGEFDLAFYFLNKGINSNDEIYKPYLSFTLGRLYFNLSLFDKAEIEFRRFLLKYAESDLIDDTIYYLGKSYYKQKKYKEAKDEFNIIIKNYPKSEYFFYSYYYLGKITGNKIYFEYILLNNPSFENIDYVFYYLGRLEDNKDLAKIYFENCINKTNDKMLAYNSLIYMLNFENDYKEKLNLILKYINNIENKEKIFNYALNLIYNNLSFDFFQTIYETHYLNNKEFYENNYEILYNLGRVFALKKDFEKSLEFFLKSYKINQNDYKLNYYLGYSLYELGKHEEAIVYLNNAIEKAKRRDLFYDLSIKLICFYYIEKNDLNKAFTLFSNFIENNPSSPIYYEILYYHSIVSYNLKKYDIAYNSIKKCLNGVKLEDQLYINVIYSSIKIIGKKNINEAAALYKEKVLQIDKNYSLAFYIIDSYINTKNYIKALEFCDLIYNSNSESEIQVDVLIKKYLIYYNLKNYEKALSELKKALNIDSNYKKDLIYYYLVELNILIKDNVFVNYFNSLIKFENKKLIFDASYLIYSYYYKEKELDKALIYLDYCLNYVEDKDSKNNILFNKANILYELNLLENSALILEDLINRQYNEFVINNFLFYIYLKLKNIEKIKEKGIFNIYNNKSEEIKYISFIYLYFLKEFDLIEEETFKNILYYFIQNKISNRTYFLAIYINEFYYNNNFEKFTKEFRSNIQSKDNYISFWTRYFFALFYYKQKDYNNAYKVFEAIIDFNLSPENEIVYYYLYFLEKKGYVKSNKYNDFNKYLKDSFIIEIIKKNLL